MVLPCKGCGDVLVMERPDGSRLCAWCWTEQQLRLQQGDYEGNVTDSNRAVTPVTPDLAGRVARCAYFGGRKAVGSYSSSSCKSGRDATSCRCEEPSSGDLAFFEYQGLGSRNAAICKYCGMTEGAHEAAQCRAGSLKKHATGTRYEAQGDVGYDKFYCGCHGWD